MKRVLVVSDDEALLTLVVQLLLERYGDGQFSLEFDNQVNHAKRMVMQGGYDLIISGLVLPKKSVGNEVDEKGGIKVAKAAIQQDPKPEVLIHANSESVTETASLGHVPVPIVTTLEGVIDQLQKMFEVSDRKA